MTCAIGAVPIAHCATVEYLMFSMRDADDGLLLSLFAEMALLSLSGTFWLSVLRF